MCFSFPHQHLSTFNTCRAGGNHIPALTEEEWYRYLGVPIGLVHNIDDLPSIVPRLIHDMEVIRSSLLAPWQKLDAIGMLIPSSVTKKTCDDYIRMLSCLFRDICSPPDGAIHHISLHTKRLVDFLLHQNLALSVISRPLRKPSAYRPLVLHPF